MSMPGGVSGGGGGGGGEEGEGEGSTHHSEERERGKSVESCRLLGEGELSAAVSTGPPLAILYS